LKRHELKRGLLDLLSVFDFIDREAQNGVCEAWELIAAEQGTDTEDIEAARTRLANIVLRIAKENDAHNAEEMIEVAVDVMRSGS